MLTENQLAIRRCFNRAATTYDQHCNVQLAAGMQLIALIPSLCAHARIIDLGCGTGLISAKLAATIDYQSFYAIDIADQCLLCAKQRLQNHTIHIRHLDYDNIPHHYGFFDLLFANMSLQWSANLEETFKKLHPLLHKNGILAFSLPTYGTFNQLKQEPLACHTFYKAEFIQDLLHRTHYKILTQFVTTHTYHFTTLHAALRSIKKCGANYVKKRCADYWKNLRANNLLDGPMDLDYVIHYFCVSPSGAVFV